MCLVSIRAICCVLRDNAVVEYEHSEGDGGHGQLPVICLPGEFAASHDLAVEEGGRRQSPPATDGLYAYTGNLSHAL